MKNRRTKVRFPVFGGYEVRVIIARDMARTGRRLHVDLADCEGAFVTPDGGPMWGYLVLKPDADGAVIAHEAAHAVQALFRAVGARRDEETYSYHLGYLVGRIHRFIKR